MKVVQKALLGLAGLLGVAQVAAGIDLDMNSYDSIYDACKLLADGLMDYYWGNDYGGTIGMFTHPYYWWEAGGAFGTMIDYSYFFDNDTYVSTIIQSMMYQKGDDNNFMPLNQTTTEGNDDQVFWGIAAIQAAERNFTEAGGDNPTYLELAQATFNTMKNRWDDSSCGGGLRWQIFEWNNGYDYKNTVSNAGLFHLGARLLRYTGNESYYLDWCELSYDWMVDVGFVNEEKWYAYDGADIVNGSCSPITSYLWTYNLALLLSGCAYMYNFTQEEVWYNRTMGFLESSKLFFDSYGVMYEWTCMPVKTCQTDQRSFRAYLARFMELTAMLVPDTYDIIYERLNTTAKAVALSCVGGTDGHTCGMNWSYSGLNNDSYGWDGYYGLGEQMSALEVVQSLVAKLKHPPYTSTDGGSSTGNVLYGNETYVVQAELLDLDRGDTAGASIITAVVGITIIALGYYAIV